MKGRRGSTAGIRMIAANRVVEGFSILEVAAMQIEVGTVQRTGEVQ